MKTQVCCWLIPLAWGAAVCFAEPPKPVSLFDGKTLQGWRIADANAYEKPGEIVVKEGAIVMPQGLSATGIVYGKDDFHATIMKFRCKQCEPTAAIFSAA